MGHTSSVALSSLALSLLITSGCSRNAPDAAMQAILDGIARGKPSAIWDGLPATYQNDIQTLCAGVAAKLDSDLYKESIGLLGRFMKELEKKQFFIRDSMPPWVPRGFASTYLDVAFEIFGELAQSQLASVDGIRKLDVGRFLDTTGKKVFDNIAMAVSDQQGEDPRTYLHGITVEADSVNGTVATLRINSQKMARTTKIRVELVEGKWVPYDLTKAWPQAMAKMRQAVARIPPMSTPEARTKIRDGLREAEKQLAALQKAQTKKQIRAALGSTPPR